MEQLPIDIISSYVVPSCASHDVYALARTCKSFMREWHTHWLLSCAWTITDITTKQVYRLQRLIHINACNIDFPKNRRFSTIIAKFGNIHALKWVRSKGCPWDETTCSYAAMNGHLEVLKWARSDGCPWDEYTCSHAAENGHLELLKWARSEGCPWDEYTCSHAAENGHLELLKFARSEGCPWDETTCSRAAMNGHFEMLKWVRSEGCPWNVFTCAYTAICVGVLVNVILRRNFRKAFTAKGGPFM
jgi:hypothetical protein